MVLRVPSIGYALFAATTIALGITILAKGDFVVPWSGVPDPMPARAVLAYACGVLLVGSGAGLFWRPAAKAASRALLGLGALWMLAFRLPLLVRAPTSSGVWWACGEAAVMLGTAGVLVFGFAVDRDDPRSGLAGGSIGLRVARAIFGLGLIPFGIAHFTFLQRTVGMVPGWLPWHLGWAYATGIAFIAAGVAVATGVLARVAAALVALQMGLFTLIVWVPVMMAHPSPSDWAEFIDSWVLTVAAWVVADSFATRRGSNEQPTAR
jgi:uncharacterized membrane protein